MDYLTSKQVLLPQNQLLFLWLENISVGVLLFEYGASSHKNSRAGRAEVDRILCRFPLDEDRAH